MHGFPVRTPICHIVPISRIYPPPPLSYTPPTPNGHFQGLGRGPRGASHEKFHAAPFKKQARFLEDPLSLGTQGKSDLLRSPFASKKVLRGTFRGLPPFAPLLGVGGGGIQNLAPKKPENTKRGGGQNSGRGGKTSRGDPPRKTVSDPPHLGTSPAPSLFFPPPPPLWLGPEKNCDSAIPCRGQH